MEEFGRYNHMNRRRPMYHHQYYRPGYMGPNYYAKQNNQKNEKSSNHVEKPCPPVEAKKEERKIDQDPFFEIFGIKFYFDDLLIIALLFCLYKEEVDDPWLFIALVLLLIT